MNHQKFKPFCLEVWADYACFTRPEMKVERVSYDVPTPSSVRAVFESIFWKPAIYWQVNRIEVINPIKWTSVRRNEVGAVMSPRSDGLFIEDVRQQRAGLFLKDVRYRFYATMMYLPPEHRRPTFTSFKSILKDEQQTDNRMDESPGKYLAMFERRARKGQCFTRPYLGCREFSCHYRLVDEVESVPEPIKETRDLGFMLYDMDFSDPDNPQPMFFRAMMQNGIIEVPDRTSEEVRR